MHCVMNREINRAWRVVVALWPLNKWLNICTVLMQLLRVVIVRKVVFRAKRHESLLLGLMIGDVYIGEHVFTPSLFTLANVVVDHFLELEHLVGPLVRVGCHASLHFL